MSSNTASTTVSLPLAADSLSDSLVEFAANLTATSLPTEVMGAARRRVADVLGIAAAASAQDFGKRFTRLPVPSEPSSAGATAIGLASHISPDDAALINGSLAHGLDFDDTYQPGIVHIGAVVVPCAMAVGEAEGHSTDDVLAAIVLGYEVASRLAEASPGEFHRAGFHATPICGAFAAALVAAKLLGLDDRTIRDAFGIVGSFAAGIQEFLRDGSDTKRLHTGWAAHAGIRAARLAAIGFSGPHKVLEGTYGLFATHLGLETFHPSAVLDGLGERWNILDVSVKPYPCCHLLHAHIDAVRQLVADGVDPAKVTRIHASIHQAGLHLLTEPIEEKRSPSTTYGAQFSLPYAIAVAMLDERIDVGSFGADRLKDPAVRRLAALTECGVDDDSRYPRYFDGAVEVWLDDGSQFSRREEVNLGSPERPLDDTQLVGKFSGNLESAGVNADEAARFAADLLGGGDLVTTWRAVNEVLTARAS